MFFAKTARPPKIRTPNPRVLHIANNSMPKLDWLFLVGCGVFNVREEAGPEKQFVQEAIARCYSAGVLRRDWRIRDVCH